MSYPKKILIYPVVITFSSVASLIFNQNLIVGILSRLSLIIVTGFIYFDKEYRQMYIPDVKDSYFKVWFIIIPFITILQYTDLFDNHLIVIKIIGLIFIITLLFFIFNKVINRYSGNKKL